MSDLLEILESFNRKERYFLIAQALGKPKFELSPEFRGELEVEICVDIPEDPDKVFVAMDYHLNWIHASLVLAHCSDVRGRQKLLNNGMIKDNQEDVDLLVAFKKDKLYHLVFIEAKAYNSDGMSDGLSGFDFSQQARKSHRLKKIVYPNGKAYGDVQPHFCLMHGRDRPEQIAEWDRWLELRLPYKRRIVIPKVSSVMEVSRDFQGRPRSEREIVPPSK